MIRSNKITIDKTIYSRVDHKFLKQISHLFEYTDITHWKYVPSKAKRQPVFEKKLLIGKTNFSTGRAIEKKNFIYKGLIPSVRKYCKEKGILTRIVKKDKRVLTPDNKPILTNIKFREDQRKAILLTINKNMGRVVAPTRSGKTIVQLGIVSMYKLVNCLILAHTKDLVEQLGDEAKKYISKSTSIFIPSGSKEIKKSLILSKYSGGLIITTVQSMANVPVKEYQDLFDIVLVDEVHHVNNRNSLYSKVLSSMNPIKRFGFTATLPTSKSQELFNEAMFGEVIFELSYDKAIRRKIIAVPEVKLINIPLNKKIASKLNSEDGYQEYYQKCIVDNLDRNQKIANVVKRCLELKYPVLIIVEKIKHGKNIQKQIKEISKYYAPFVHGKTNKNTRIKKLEHVKSEKRLATICSRIWMEGITMQNLRVVIWAGAMKDKKKVLQAMGRGLGTTKNKNKITLVDFIDPYKFLYKHSIMRKKIYKEKNWL